VVATAYEGIPVSILYCTVPDFAAALARRDDPALEGRPLVLIGPENRVWTASAEAAACGIVPGVTARAAEVRCPEARLLVADIPRCRAELETMLGVLEQASASVEPHGWGAAYVDLAPDLAGSREGAMRLCSTIGRALRREMGPALQPALGWNSTKFTAQAAARRTQPGRLMAVSAAHERPFLKPLPVTLLPLDGESIQRLRFLGLRTLGQYAALPPAAVGQQFGRAGRLAQRCARGEDDRPVLPRRHSPGLAAACDLETPLADRERLLAELRRLAAPLLAELRASLQSCGQVRLSVHLDDHSAQEQSRSFLFPVADEGRVLRALAQLLDGLHWTAAAVALEVTLEQIQDAVPEQLSLFPGQAAREQKVDEVRRYLVNRFGANHLRRAALVQPGAPLPEWRVGWTDDAGPAAPPHAVQGRDRAAGGAP
jgi:nucleotidyltransferase/DNA polymerase involved in DNA repair